MIKVQDIYKRKVMIKKIKIIRGPFFHVLWNLFLDTIFYFFNLKMIFKNKFKKTW